MATQAKPAWEYILKFKITYRVINSGKLSGGVADVEIDLRHTLDHFPTIGKLVRTYLRKNWDFDGEIKIQYAQIIPESINTPENKIILNQFFSNYPDICCRKP